MQGESPKVLVLGASGYVGRHLHDRLGPQRSVATFNKTPIEGGIPFNALDDSLKETLDRPQDISHAVVLLGETHIDTCVTDQERSRALNVDGIVAVIEDLMELGIVPVFASSDNVFDGNDGPYSETDAPNPIVVYGKQKLEVERYLESHCRDYCIVRLSKAYGIEPGDGTLFTAWYESLRNEEPIRAAADQVFSPVFIDDVVEGILRLIERNSRGTFHLCGPESVSRADFLDSLIDQAGPGLPSGFRVEKCGINDFGLVETRPLNVSMLSTKFRAETGLTPCSSKETIPRMLRNFGDQRLHTQGLK